MADSPEIRISDIDRQMMIDRLSKAYSEGRLTEGELGERIMAAGEARTAGELAELARDLPAPATAPVERSMSQGLRSRLDGTQVFFIAPIICTAIWLITTPTGYFWPIWVWFGCMIPVLFALLAGDDDDDDEADVDG